ncbi:MAG: hypothetical protein VXZ72_00025 [Chlamydiota bacterium]|nr:hypothetical protein [Chlamydiota bacterium]
MNTSVQHLIENALNQPVVESHEPVGEHSFFDEDVVKLAHALDFVSGNLDNIGTMEEKVAELHMLQEKLAMEVPNTTTVDPITKPTKGGNVTAFNPTVITDAPSNPSSSVRGAVANVSPDDARTVRSGTRQAYLSGAEAGKRKGLAAAGFGDAIKNTWKSGMGGKAALIGGGALTAGLVGKALFGGGDQRKTASYYGFDDEYEFEKFASASIEDLIDFLDLDETRLYVMEKAASLHGDSLHEWLVKEAGKAQKIRNFMAQAERAGNPMSQADATALYDKLRSQATKGKKFNQQQFTNLVNQHFNTMNRQIGASQGTAAQAEDIISRTRGGAGQTKATRASQIGNTSAISQAGGFTPQVLAKRMAEGSADGAADPRLLKRTTLRDARAISDEIAGEKAFQQGGAERTKKMGRGARRKLRQRAKDKRFQRRRRMRAEAELRQVDPARAQRRKLNRSSQKARSQDIALRQGKMGRRQRGRNRGTSGALKKQRQIPVAQRSRISVMYPGDSSPVRLNKPPETTYFNPRKPVASPIDMTPLNPPPMGPQNKPYGPPNRPAGYKPPVAPSKPSVPSPVAPRRARASGGSASKSLFRNPYAIGAGILGAGLIGKKMYDSRQEDNRR